MMEMEWRPTGGRGLSGRVPGLSVSLAAWLHPQAQNELLWSIKDELKKACSTNDLKELLIFNKQQVPSGESAVSCPPQSDLGRGGRHSTAVTLAPRV